ncbi:MAG: hypothetical protein IJV07_05790 [Alphaproteobacteria bacterium]|nr:hypothetical protein [Alphaproteobacteria bacterium]
MDNKQKILNQIQDSFKNRKDFTSFLCRKVQFNGRDWTYGQFLYKHYFDEVQKFLFYARDNWKKLSEQELDLAKKGKFLVEENRMTVPNSVFMTEKIQELNLFNGDRKKEDFYRNLFANPKRSTKNNPVYWPPMAQYQFLVIEHKLQSEMGMTPGQVRSLMVHCEQEREKTEDYYQKHKPEFFVHNSPVLPEKMGGGIQPKLRSVNNFINTQRYCFVAEPNSFHSGLPIQGNNWWLSWPLFKPKILAVSMTEDEFEEKTKNGSYNYIIDPKQKNIICPVIPLWGGKPVEWVSTERLNYTSVQKETLQDLSDQGMKFYIIPDKEVWKKKVQGKAGLTEKDAQAFLEEMCKNGEAVKYNPKDTSMKGMLLKGSDRRKKEPKNQAKNTEEKPVFPRWLQNPSWLWFRHKQR